MTNIYNKVVNYPNNTLIDNWFEESELRKSTGNGRTLRGSHFGKITFDPENPKTRKIIDPVDDTYRRVIGDGASDKTFFTFNSLYGSKNLDEKVVIKKKNVDPQKQMVLYTGYLNKISGKPKLKDIIPNDNFTEILKEFQNVVKEFKQNNFLSKQKIVNQLNDEITNLKKAINKIEASYKKNYMINYELSKLIENIIQNYRLSMIIPDYNNIMNFINNTKYSHSLNFNGYDPNSIDNSINNLILFYNSNYIISLKEKNFSLNKLEQITTINEIKHDINSLIIMKDNRLAAAEEKVIKIFEINENLNYKYDIKIEGHTANVHYLYNMKEGKLLSSSADKTIKIWILSKNAYTCEITLEGHYKWVFNVIQLNNNNIASCSLDNTIKIWSGNFPYSNIKTLTGHTHGVTCIIQIKDGRIVSGSNDDSIRFWNMSTYECIENQTIYDVICCKMDSITQVDDFRLFVGGWKFLTVINIQTYQIITKIEIHNDEINAVLYLDNGSLISGSNDGFIKQIDINNFKNDDYGAIKTRDNINCIRKFGDNCIICAGKGIKIFKLKE